MSKYNHHGYAFAGEAGNDALVIDNLKKDT